MKFTSLYNQPISAGLYKSSYFMNKRILYKPLVSSFLIFFVAIVIKIPSKYDDSNIIFLSVNLIVNKRVRVLIFLFWDSWSSYLQHISTTSLKSVFEKWPVTVFKCALFPGRCHIASIKLLVIVLGNYLILNKHYTLEKMYKWLKIELSFFIIMIVLLRIW